MSETNSVIDLPLIEGFVGTPVDTAQGEKTVKEALWAVARNYDWETAEWVERIWRKETAHFRHGFTKTNGAGMHPWGRKFPWGWRDMKGLWANLPQTRPIGYTYMVEGGTGKRRKYLVFPSPTAFALSLATMLHRRMERKHWSIERAAGSWYSRYPWAAKKYARDALKIKPRFCAELKAERQGDI